MGRYVKISLALFYFLQIFITFRESAVLLVEGAADLARNSLAGVDGTEQAREEYQRPPRDSLVRRSLVFLKHAFSLPDGADAKISSGLAATLVINHELHHSADSDDGDEHANGVKETTRRRQVWRCIRNLFTDILKRAIPPGCETAHRQEKLNVKSARSGA
ncbi:hypothetical protein HY633_02090 [Candidatus Uhrbacteria bacterium]|nr:hypothetical protein [Candidatus Uhrbacteria bacterium]